MSDINTLFIRIKKKQIDQAAILVKYILTAFVFIIPLLTFRSLVKNYLETHTLTDKFYNETQPLPYKKYTLEDISRDNKELDTIVEKNIFGPLSNPTPAQAINTKPVQKSTLILAGTDLGGGNEASAAIIEDPKKGIQDVFLLNDTIFGEAKLIKISRDQVEIERAGEKEILKLEEGGNGGSGDSSGGRYASDGGEIVVSESDVDSALSNLPLLLTEIRAVPYFKDGQAVGLRLFAIKSGSLFDKIGMKNGDILKSINGNSMGDFTQAIKLFEKLKTERSLKVLMERNREEKEYSYTIK